ncbi:MAG: OmpA family protein [Treponema sp.]|jgi:outer membrane protein OmpA-like peptidoglycan-associated protein|nr:OmpA family protein [Treponema sp.]
MKKTFFALLVLSAALFSAQRAAAQTAAELERVLGLQTVTYGDAAWLILNAAGTALPEDSAEGAYRFAADNKWVPKKAAAETPVTLGGVSFLIMKTFNIKGGLMYTLFPGPRYGYRELAYRKIIQGRAYSTMTVSGERLLRILSRVLEYAGDTPVLQAAAAEREPEIPVIETPAKIPLWEERERIIGIINTELTEKSVTDTDVRATDQGITISLNNIQFLPDSTELMEAEKRKLQNIAVILNEFPDRRILVGGHTALAGSAEGRMKISEDRARAVADYLVSLGCRKQNEITVLGYGAEQPLGDPATEAGQALNRRVEITLLDGGSGG